MVYKMFTYQNLKKGFLLIPALFLTYCFAQDFPSVSAEEAYKMKTEKDSIVFIDVRTNEEYIGPLGHIEGSVLIPLQQLEQNVNQLDSLKEYEMVVYCRSGNRSQTATRFLREKGFNAQNMLGGIKAWNNIKDKK
jgi:rhodanese-related sulfurtransferase